MHNMIKTRNNKHKKRRRRMEKMGKKFSKKIFLSKSKIKFKGEERNYINSLSRYDSGSFNIGRSNNDNGARRRWNNSTS